MNTTIRTKDIRCQEVLPPIPGNPAPLLNALVEIDDGRGHLSMSVGPEGVTKARELAALLNAAADAVEALENDAAPMEAVDARNGTPETSAAEAVAESLDRETVEVGHG